MWFLMITIDKNNKFANGGQIYPLTIKLITSLIPLLTVFGIQLTFVAVPTLYWRQFAKLLFVELQINAVFLSAYS